MPGKPVHVLLVEDDALDIDLLKRAFRRKRIANEITVAYNGVEALRLLRGDANIPALPQPYVILLDIHMPIMNGIEFLAELRQDKTLDQSIVFVLTGSVLDADILAAYRLHVAGYIRKDRIGDEFLELPQLIEHYWHLVEFPLR